MLTPQPSFDISILSINLSTDPFVDIAGWNKAILNRWTIWECWMLHFYPFLRLPRSPSSAGTATASGVGRTHRIEMWQAGFPRPSDRSLVYFLQGVGGLLTSPLDHERVRLIQTSAGFGHRWCLLRCSHNLCTCNNWKFFATSKLFSLVCFARPRKWAASQPRKVKGIQLFVSETIINHHS